MKAPSILWPNEPKSIRESGVFSRWCGDCGIWKPEKLSPRAMRSQSIQIPPMRIPLKNRRFVATPGEVAMVARWRHSLGLAVLPLWKRKARRAGGDSGPHCSTRVIFIFRFRIVCRDDHLYPEHYDRP